LGQPTQAGIYATGASYFPNGALKQFTYGNGIVHTLTQNARGLPERSRDAFGGVAYHDDTMDYDLHGNVAAITDGLPGNRGDRTMAYDLVDRLTSTVSPMFGTAIYGYDALDNLVAVQLTGGARARNHTYHYDSNRRLTSVNNAVGGAVEIALSYDAQGNLQSKNGQQFVFDHGNRLREVVGVEQYRYDGHGRRVRATHPTQGSIYSMYGAEGVLRYQRDERTGKAMAHVYLGGSQVARLEDPISLAAPALSAPESNSTGGYVVSWSGVGMATRYELQERKDGGPWSLVHNDTATSKALSERTDGSHEYRARACNQIGCGAYSDSATTVVTLPPAAAPTVTAPATNSTGAFTVSWTAAATATRYELRQRKNADSWSTVHDAAATSIALSALSDGSYEHQARACNLGGCSAYSSVTTTVVTIAPGSTPTVTAPATNATGAFTVSWTAVVASTRYELEQRKDAGTWSKVHDAAATSQSVSGLSTGTYDFRARACNGPSCGAYSATVTTVVTLPPTAAPTVTAPASNATGAFTVNWTSVATATGYELQQRTDGGAWSTVQDAAATSKAVSGLTAGTYEYQARACNAGGCGAYSAITSTVVTLPPVSAPTVTAPASNTTGAFTVNWTNVATATRYELQQRTDGGAWSTVQDAAATSKAVSGLTAGTYGHQARACNAGGCGAYSAIANTVVTLPPASAPTVSAPGSNATGAFTVSWTGVATATRYELQQRKDGGAWSTVQDAAATSKAVSGLTAGSYGYQARACNAGGCGAYSAIASTVVTLTPAPAVPAWLAVVESLPGWYQAGWTASTGATSYELRLAGGSTIYTGPATSTEFGSFQVAQYSVRACNATGCSAWSAPVSPIPFNPGPLEPEPFGLLEFDSQPTGASSEDKA
jgi:YD repeat-containing protein